jgi:proteasome lid subunit RPN8/RPN11
VIPTKAAEAIKDHALQEYPKECCGFLTPQGYVPVQNVAPDPINDFMVSPRDYLNTKDKLMIVHSHPVQDAFDHLKYKPGFWPFCPTQTDMEGQLLHEMPWAIVVTDGKSCTDPFHWGDHLLDLPLIGREFRHGVTDCYSAIRAWFKQEVGAYLPDIPRNDNWWETDLDLYHAKGPSVGLRKLRDGEKPKRGDVGLMKVGGQNVKTVNHGLVYLGDGTVYHHLPGRLSRREAFGGRLTTVAEWMRHRSME